MVGGSKDQSRRRTANHTLGKWLGAGLDLLFPIQCAGCRESGSVWCDECDGQLLKIRHPICDVCGRGLPASSGLTVAGTANSSCPSCRERVPALQVRSYARYTDSLVRALLNLKYRPNRQLAGVMGEWLAELLNRVGWTPLVIVPVPLAARRQQQRGFNQAELLAQALSQRTSLPVQSGALKRVGETRSQVGLDRWERWPNVANAFQVEDDRIPEPYVLLVDDLMTTGATLSACADALRAAGVERIRGLTVGRA